ncbi:tetratricopeptide repeat protein [Phycisphaeraceae bacterium D3-23]
MATRINTKFAIILAVAVVIIGVGGAFAAKKFIFKSAQQYASEGDQFLEDAQAAFAAGDIEEANALFDRAARRYNAANRKAEGNNEYVYKSIIANAAYICESTTEAQNRLGMITGARQIAHDSVGATEEDQVQYYEGLMARHRMGLVIDGYRPWIGNLYGATDAQLDVDEDNALARRWRGIAGVYLLRNDMPPEERIVPLDDLKDALEDTPNDALLLHHVAVWHSNEARRIRNAEGGATTESITRLEAQSREYSAQALAADPDDPYNRLSHLDILMRSPLDEEVRDAILTNLLVLGQQLADNADDRALLYDAEIQRVVGWLAALPQIIGDPEDARGQAPMLALAQATVADAPDHMSRYLTLATAHLAMKNYEAAVQALEDGLATDRPLGPQDYLLDLQTRVAMFYQLALTYVTMAADANPDAAQRDALVAKADEVLARYNASEGADSRHHQANIDFLKGRAAFVQGVPHLAIQHLEAANRVRQNGDLQTLMLLAKAHDLNGNTGKAIDYYELLLAPGMQPGATNERFRLVRLYIGLGGGENLERANELITAFIGFNPENAQARLLKAEIMAAAERYDVAAQIIETLDLETNPQFTGTYAGYLAQDGKTEEALALLRARLEVDANDNSALGVLFSLITGPEAQQAELDQLLAHGLNEENASRIRRVIDTGGQMSIEDWIAFQAESGTPELDINKALFNTYRRTGDEEKMREVLAELVRIAPNDKHVLEWRFAVAVADKDWALADRVITSILALDPSERSESAASNGAFLRAQVQAGRIVDEAGEGETPNLRDVVRTYTNALEENDTFAPGWVALGQVYLIQQDYARARDAFDRAYRIQRTNTQAAILLARTLRQTGEIDAALDLYRETTRRQPGNTALMNEYLTLEANAGDRPTAIAQREALRETRPQDSANRRMLALMYAQSERTDDALAEIDAIIAYEGVTRQSAIAKAEIYTMDGQGELGLAQMRDFIEGKGEAVEELDYLAYAEYLLRNGQAEAAESVFRQAIAIENPEARQASRVWADALVKQGRLDEAAAAYNDLIRSFPDSGVLKMQLVPVQIAMAQYDQALSTLGGVPASAEREALRAQAERFRGNTEEALAIVVNAQRTYEDNTALLNLQGQLLTVLGELAYAAGENARGQERFEQALAVYMPMVERNASLYEIRVQIARIQNVLGNSEDAVTRLVRVLDERPDLLSARLSLFSLYLMEAHTLPEGDTRRQSLAGSALTVISPMLEDQPDNPAALRGAGEAAGVAGQHRQSAQYYGKAFGISGEAGDLFQYVTALLADGRPGDVVALLDNPDNANHVRDSIVLRAMRGRALAGTNKLDEARNLFRSVLGSAASDGERTEVTRQIAQSRLRREASQIVQDVLGDERPTGVELQLAFIERVAEDWSALIDRLSPYEGNPTGDPVFDHQAMMMLALSYQSVDGEEATIRRGQRIYERLLENPNNANNMELLNNLAYLLSDQLQGQDFGRQAVTYAQRAADLVGPNAPDEFRAQVLDTLGWAHYRAGNIDEARTILRQSIDARSLGVNNMHLGLVYMSLGGENNDLQAERYLDDGRRASNDPEERAKIQAYLDEIDSR